MAERFNECHTAAYSQECLQGMLWLTVTAMQVKAWCYYESRLLGAPHGLISTYALETMVLYIFNVYHNSLHTPCKVWHEL